MRMNLLLSFYQSSSTLNPLSGYLGWEALFMFRKSNYLRSTQLVWGFGLGLVAQLKEARVFSTQPRVTQFNKYCGSKVIGKRRESSFLILLLLLSSLFLSVNGTLYFFFFFRIIFLKQPGSSSIFRGQRNINLFRVRSSL